MMRQEKQIAPRLSIVTGASSGLGHAFAKHLAKAGSDLVLVARNKSRLDDYAAQLNATYAVQVHPLALDLSLSESARAVFEGVRQLGKTPDALINNAGFNVYGRFEETDLEKEIEMISLHTVSLTQITKEFLRLRDRRQRNRILNVSSVAALVPGPFVSVHFATRAHLLSFSLALSEEFRGTDVDVTCLCPGPMRTDFFRRAGMDDVRLASGWPMPSMSPSEVAAHGYNAMMRGKRMIVPGWRNKIFACAADVAPRAFKVRFTKWIMDRR